MFLAKNTAKNNRKMDERWWWKERSNAASPFEHTEAIGHVKCLLDPCIHSAIVIIFSCLFPSELHVKAQKITSDVHILELHPMTFLTETYGFGQTAFVQYNFYPQCIPFFQSYPILCTSISSLKTWQRTKTSVHFNFRRAVPFFFLAK